MDIRGLHHLAMRCNDAKETVEWYRCHLKMDYLMAMAEELVPTSGQPTAYMHVYLDAGAAGHLTFFELPDEPPMGRDSNTPDWVQHVSFRLGSVAELEAEKSRLEREGVAVRGLIDHVLFQSIYVTDPNGHKLEFSTDTADENALEKLANVKEKVLAEWDRTKRPPHHARWVLEHLFAGDGGD